MTWMPIEWARRVSPADERELPHWLHLAGSVLRAVFIACLLVITVRVSMPQNETIWTVYDTPGDLVRLLLGVAVCLWIAVQLFRAPKDAHSRRTFLYFGIAAVPFAALCVYKIW